ncbi:MAG: antibiotic biosynthesis monooxygenase [Alphaproteobacteria bacterium]|nr:antibiotic biosynthesis monooxygenase [Alphaproteobacteria bacterium]MCW5738712.1 antibiotic biosynthesis monooxygenase [Alphaproteobacteria bacterium]
MPALDNAKPPVCGTVAFTITWEAKPGEVDALLDVLDRMTAAVRANEPGTLQFRPHRSPDNDHVFFLYELFVDQAAYETHLATPHFRTLILDEAVPKLARRERVAFTPLA